MAFALCSRRIPAYGLQFATPYARRQVYGGHENGWRGIPAAGSEVTLLRKHGKDSLRGCNHREKVILPCRRQGRRLIRQRPTSACTGQSNGGASLAVVLPVMRIVGR